MLNKSCLYFAGISLLVLSGLNAQAQTAGQVQDTYKYQLRGSFKVQTDCMVKEQKVRSTIKLYVDQNALNSPAEILPAYVKLRVCTPIGFIKDAIPVPIPLAVIRAGSILALNTMLTFPWQHPSLAVRFPQGDVPDKLTIQKTDSKSGVDVFEMKLIESKSGQTKIGPIRLMVGVPQTITNVSGFDLHRHLPIRGIEIEVPESNVSLRSTLIEIGSESLDQ